MKTSQIIKLTIEESEIILNLLAPIIESTTPEATLLHKLYKDYIDNSSLTNKDMESILKLILINCGGDIYSFAYNLPSIGKDKFLLIEFNNISGKMDDIKFEIVKREYTEYLAKYK